MVSKEDVQDNYSAFMDASQKALDSMQFNTDLEEINKNMDVLQEEKEEQQEDEQLNIQVQREAKFEEEKRVSKIVMDRKLEVTIKEKLFDQEGNMRMDIVPQITKVELSKEEIYHFVQFLSSKKFSVMSNDRKLLVSHVGMSNYRQLNLGILEATIEEKLKVPEKETFLDIERFLEPSKEQSSISDEFLNMLDDYIVDDSDSQRNRIIAYCRDAIQLNPSTKLVQPALELFLNQSSIIEGNKNIGNIFKKYKMAFQTFAIEQNLKILLRYQQFVDLLASFPDLEELWTSCEEGKTQRSLFDEKIKTVHRDVKKLYDLNQAYKKMHEAIDSKFNWETCTSDPDFMALFYTEILVEGLNFTGYVQLLGDVFNVRINLYSTSDKGELSWKDSFCITETRSMHVLKNGKTGHEMLAVNEKYMQMENERYLKGKHFNHILWDVFELNTKVELDEYTEKFKSKELNGLPKNFSLNCQCETNDIEFILQKVSSSSKTIKLKSSLRSIRNKVVPNNIVLHLLAKRFSYEVCQISDQELVFLLNSILQAHLRHTQEIPLIQWIIATKPQANWTAEIIFLHLQNYYKTKIVAGKSMLKLLHSIEKKELLLLFDLQLQNTPDEMLVPFKTVYDIFKLLVRVKIIPHNLYETDVGNWLYVLQGAYWHGRLYDFFESASDDDLNIAIYYVQTLENYYGEKLLNEFINALNNVKKYINSIDVLSYLTQFVSEDWKLSNETNEQLSKAVTAEDVQNWKIQVSDSLLNESNSDRPTDILRKIIDKDSKSSQNSRDVLKDICESLENKDYKEIVQSLKNVMTMRDLKDKIPTNIKDDIQSTLRALALIDQCVFLLRNFRLRDTQKLSVLMLLSNPKSNLLQVSTGEGKTLIVVAVAIIKALRGELVDVITSSPVLAKRDAAANKDIYECFGVSVFHNCDEKMQNRIKAYSSNKVIYGDISAFQRDYLLDRFYGKNILGDRNFQNILVDEVDSMLLDKGNNMLYLSHDLPWLDKLSSVYIYIWQWVNQPTTNNQMMEYVFDENVLRERILHDIFGLVTAQDIANLDKNLSDGEVTNVLQILKENNVINNDGTAKEYKTAVFDDMFKATYSHLIDRMKFLFSEIENREQSLLIPNCLKKFVVQHLDSWIRSAHNAFFMKEKENYIVDVNRTDINLEQSPNIIILDKDTGTDQANSQWDEALHQFLQLKHGCKLSAQSLKAVFVSNVSYFKIYTHIYGLTGTLGTERERELLKGIHEVDYVTMPTSKPKKFKEMQPVVCSDSESWIQEIKAEVQRVVKSPRDKRSVLMICETVEQVDMFKKQFATEKISLTTYTRDYEDFDFSSEQTLEVGHVLISTNLAGRGTDIKISDDLVKNGGLHVVLTFLPKNSRIEQQAYGRAARCGQPGTAKMIFYKQDAHIKNVILLKRDRDNEELQRVSEIKKHYEMSILVQEECFKLFQSFYLRMKENFKSKLRWHELFRRIKSQKSKGRLSLGDIVDTKLRNNSSNVNRDIVLQAFLDEWAYWLDAQNESIAKISTKPQFEAMLKSARAFITDLEKRRSNIEMVGRNPSALLKLAKFYIQNKKSSEAINLLNLVIVKEPHFAESAYYYKAMALGNIAKWNRNAIDIEVKPLLLKSRRLFESKSDICYFQAAAIAKLKKGNNSKLVQINAFEDQMANTRRIYDTYINSVDDILGHSLTPNELTTDGVKNWECEDLYKKLKQDEVLSKTSLHFTKETDTFVQKTAKDYGISYQELKSAIERHAGDDFDIMSFARDLKKLNYPSRERFWKHLLYIGALVEEDKFYEINLADLEEYNASLKKLIDDQYSNSKEPLPEKENLILLYPLSAEGIYAYLKAHECKKVFDEKTMKTLKANNIARKNKMAVLQRQNLVKIREYCCIDKEHLVAQNISPSEAELILRDLERNEYLETVGKEYYVKDFTKEIAKLEFKDFPIYNHVMRSLIRFQCCYKYAAYKLDSDNSIKVVDMLPCKTHTSLLLAFADEAISKSKVIYKKELQFEKDKVKNFYDHLPEVHRKEKTAKGILQVLFRSRSFLYNLEAPEGTLEDLSKRFENANSDFASLLNSFALNGLEDVIAFKEQTYTTKMILSTIAVIVMGIAQLIIGVAIEVFSVGAMTWVGAGFINEGINDLMFAACALYSGHFSWADYGRQKLISLAFTVCAFGLAAYFSKGAKVSRFGSKLFSAGDSAAELAGKELIEKVGMKTILKECSKRVAVKAVQGLAFGAVSAGVDAMVSNYIRQYCDSLSEKMLDNVNESLNRHCVSLLMKKAYDKLGPAEARKVLMEANNEFFSEKNIESKYISYCKTVSDVIARGFAEAASKNSSASLTGSQIIRMCGKVVVLAEKTCSIYKMTTLTDRMLDEMELKLREEIDKKPEKESKSDAVSSEADFEKFKLEMTDVWKASVNKHVGTYIAQTVVSPILKSCGFFAVKQVGRAIKGCYNWCTKADEGHKHTIKFNPNKKLEEMERKTELTEEIDNSLQEQNDVLLKEAMEASRDPKEVATCIRKGAAMEMTSAQAAVDILEDRLDEKVALEVTDKNGTYRIESNKPGNGAVRVIRVNLQDNHFTNANGEVVRLEGLGRNDCLFQAVSSEVDLKMSPSEFRNEVANIIESDNDLGKFVESGSHAEFIQAGFIGGHELPGRRNRVVRIEEIEPPPGESGSQPGEDTSTPKKRGRPRKAFDNIETKTEVTSEGGERTYKIEGNFTCDTENAIYDITCNECDAHYVGSSKRKVRYRLGEHRRSVNKGKDKALADHAKSHNNSNFEKLFKVAIIDAVPAGAPYSVLIAREQQWINDLQPSINRIDANKENKRPPRPDSRGPK